MLGCTPCHSCKYFKICNSACNTFRPERLEICELRHAMGLSCRECVEAGKCIIFKKNEERKKKRNVRKK